MECAFLVMKRGKVVHREVIFRLNGEIMKFMEEEKDKVSWAFRNR